MPGGDDVVRSTGGQVDEMTMALIDSAFDRSEDCQSIICLSLFNLGKKKPELVLSSCYSYLKKHSKLAQGHRVALLQSVERILKDTLSTIDSGLAIDLIKLASNELTLSKEVVPEWQTAASGVLVALGMEYCNEVMEEMLQKFQPGALPHFFVVQTIANLASANVYGMVPHLTAVLGTMLPMLGMAKHDNMRWVFASAISKFSEAIIEYIANIDKAPDPTVKKENFSSEIFAAYDVLFNVWLQSKEIKLRLAIVEALGHMTHLMARDRLEEQLPRILAGILGLYKRHQEPYHVTQGLCSMLDAVCVDGSTILEPHLDHVLGALFPQVFAPADINNPMSIKNHNEVLRCFAVLARSFSGKLTGILLQKLEQNNEKIKIGILTIFKHLINAAAPAMEDKKEVVISGLKSVTLEQNNKVKKVFAQVIIAMGHHNYMELEGGSQMIEFIVSQCSLQNDLPGKKSPDPDYVTNTALRHMCDHVLQLLTNTVEDMESVLWPFLLELIVPEKYTEASGVVCKCVATLANKKREENADDYEIDYETQANIPKPTVMIARLLVLVGRPQNGRERGVHILNVMKGLAPNLHDGLVDLWDTVVPKLVQYLEDPEKQESWSQKSWEDLLLKMISKTLDVIDHEEWIAELGEALSQQIPSYTKYPEEKNFLYKCIGVTMRKSTKKDFVNKMLDQVFGTVKHTDQTEREGCAVALGFCATSHLDAVLTKLETVAKNDMVKKSGGLLSFMKDKSDVDIERIKATLMLCYGFVALYSPPSLIVSRMEATILRSLTPHFANVKDTSVKQNLIRTVDQIGQALHPSHLGVQYNFSNRGEFLTHLQNYMKMESLTSITNETRALAMDSCATLIKLDPILSEAEIFDLIKTATDCLLPLPPEGVVSTKKGKSDSYEETMEAEVLMEATFDSLQHLLSEILIKQCTPANFETIFKHLVPWYISLQDHERERALNITHKLLQFLLENLDISEAPRFESEYILLARLVPRCSDPSIEVRQISMDCIQVTLQVALRCEGRPEDYKDTMVEALPTLRERLQKGDPNILYSVVNDLAKVISKKLPADQLKLFVDLIQEGLIDPQSHSSSGACVVLNGIMKNRGAELIKEVDNILCSLHEKLFQVQFGPTKNGVLRTIRTMATHHLIAVLKCLFTFPLPYDENVVEIWKILAQDATLTTTMLDHMLELLQKSLPYEEKRSDGRETPIKKATQVPLAITCALTEILQVEETEEQVQKVYHRLFAALLVRVGSAIAVEPLKPAVTPEAKDPKDKKKAPPPTRSSEKPLKPSSSAVAAFRHFLELTKTEDVIEELENEECWEKLEDVEQYHEAINLLTRAMVTSTVGSKHISRIVACLTSVLSSLYDTQRIVVVSFFAELVNQKCMGDNNLVELVMNSLLGRLVDSAHVVRQMCIRGLGNVASIGKGQVQHYSTTVLSAMMAGMDDKEDPEDDITTEAMSGLSRILTEIDESHIRAILINVALRIRPCFEKDKAAVRAQAIILFGNLSAFGDGPSKLPFLEQIHSNFVSLLLHLNDPEPEVKMACKSSLRLLGALMGSEAIHNMFQKLLLDSANLHYGEFMNDLSKLIIQDFPDKVNFYVMGCVAFYKSMWSEIKSNAALFTGFLLGNLPKDRQAVISKEHVCAALIMLLKDSSPTVRSTAAEAISLLHEY